MMTPLKIIFAGTPAFSLPCLEALHKAGHSIVAVLTQPDRPSGRGQKLQASPIKEWAIEHHLSVYQPESLKSKEMTELIAQFDADVMVVVAYGLILPKTILDLPRLGCINVHASLLPRWRGAAPIQYALRSGDKITGISIMQMDQGMDTGDVLKHISCSIDAEDDSERLFNKLSLLAPPVLLESLEERVSGRSIPEPQDNHLATYAPKITKQEAQIDWSESSEQILLNLRAFHPQPCAFTSFEGKNIKIHAAQFEMGQSITTTPAGTIIAHQSDRIVVQTGNGAIGITCWQWPNEKQVKLVDWLKHKALQLPIGSRFQ
jgi:methionyl-tRNA formyltransferase